jgi:hypothetical protein
VGESPTLGDVIRRFGASLRARRGGALTPAGEAVLATLERCHTAALGGHVYRCDACGDERVAYHGCGNRHCPSCLGHKSAEWLEARAQDLLPVPYFHVVFTIPDEVGALALGNKKEVYSILYRAATETLLEIAADPKHLGAEIGFLAILHTWTQTLLHHPHIHCVVPGGGLAPDGTRFIKSRERFLLPIRVLSRVYRGKFLAFLDEARREGRLQFAGATAPLSTPRGWSSFLRQQRSKEWVVYAKPPFGSPEQVLKYLARYTHKVAIGNRRLLAVDDNGVRFTYRDRKKGVTRVMALSGEEFLRRFLLHVLPSGFVRIRYFGFLAHRGRREKLARCRELLGATPPPQATPPEPSSTEPQPKPCPVCGNGRLLWCRELDRGEEYRPVKGNDTS